MTEVLRSIFRYKHILCCEHSQAASVDEELKARTLLIKVFVMWPTNEKGKLRKPSTDAIKLNKDIDA